MKATAIYTVNEDLSVAIPYTRTPEKTDGTQILTVVYAASSPDAEVFTEFDAQGCHKTSNVSLACTLLVDEEQYARRTGATNPPGAGFVMALGLRHSWKPGDTLPHTYRIRVGALSGVMRLNGMGTVGMFGDTMAATLKVGEE